MSPQPPQTPENTYLAQLGEGSRRTMRQALGTLATLATLVAGAATEADAFDWTAVDRDAVARLRRELAERYAPSTANKMLAALRGVLRVCRDQGLITERHYQEATGFDRIKDFRKVESRVLSDAELDRLYAACSQDRTAAGRRDAALLTLYLVAGLRREEATALRLDALDLDAGVLRIESEIVERCRDLSLSDGARSHFSFWLEARGEIAGPLILPVDKGGTIRLRRLTAQSVYSVVARIGERAGVEALTPRDLRQTCLIQMIRAGCDAEALRQRVGHMSWLTTAAYQHLAEKAGGASPWTMPLAPQTTNPTQGNSTQG